MFAYLLIGIELVLLYGVFWYVCVREPKPYNIKGGTWGSYDSFASCNPREPLSLHHFPSDSDTLALECRQTAVNTLGFERRAPRPAYPLKPANFGGIPQTEPSKAEDAETSSKYLCPSYLEYSPQHGNFTLKSMSTIKEQNFLQRCFDDTLCWLDNISVKLP